MVALKKKVYKKSVVAYSIEDLPSSNPQKNSVAFEYKDVKTAANY